jgi:hypothetical protein
MRQFVVSQPEVVHMAAPTPWIDYGVNEKNHGVTGW